MNFITAKKKLKRLAKGRFHTLSYEIRDYGKLIYSTEKLEVICSVYVDGYTHYTGRTWKIALDLLNEAMNPPSVEIESIEEEK